MRLKFVACAVSALAISVAFPQAFAESVGSVAAVNRDMDGTPPEGSRRALNLGDQVVRNELIETSKVGSGQIVFLDQTTLSVAPNSNVILDKYVFDPAKGEGEIALRMTQGALRFIGGRITKSKKAIVRTPQSTIGIRGGMALITIEPDGSSRVVLMAGEFIDIEGINGNTLTLSRPNATATIDGSGNVAFAGIASSEDLAGVFKSLEGEGDGGTGEGISEDGVDNVSQVNSEEIGVANEAPVSTQGEARVGSDLELDDDSVLRELETAEVQEEPVEMPPPPPALAEELPLPDSGVALLDRGVGFRIDQSSHETVPIAEFRQGSLIALLANGAGDRITLDLPSDPRELIGFVDGAFLPDSPAGPDADPEGLSQFGFWASPLDGVDVPGYPFTSVPEDYRFNDGIAFVYGLSNVDPDNQFHALGIAYQDLDVGLVRGGSLVFGTPTPGQGVRHALDNGTAGPRENTVDIYQPIDVNLTPQIGENGEVFTGFEFGNFPGTRPLGADTSLILTANAGSDRVPSDTDTPSGARWLAAQVSENGLGVLAAPVSTTKGGAPALDASITNIRRDSIQTQGFNTVADGEANTLFGQDGQYAVVTSATAPGGFLEVVSGPELGFLPNLPATQLFERDVDAAAIVSGNSDILVSLADLNINQPVELPDIQVGDVGHMNGFFTCSTGNCGSSLTDGGNTGIWGARAVGSLSVGSTERRADGSLEGLDTNALALGVSLIPEDDVNASAGGLPLTNGGVTLRLDNGLQQGNETSTFVNDKLFGFNSPNSAITPLGISVESEFLLASSGAANQLNGTLFPDGINSDPQHVRWGYWAADLITEDGTTGAERHDTLTTGLFTFGRNTSQFDLPTDVVAEYDGLVAANVANLDTGTIETLGGDFKLTYDFRRANGVVDVAIPGAGYDFAAIPVAQNGGGFLGTQSFGTDGASRVDLDGTFFSAAGGDDPAAAVGGEVDIRDVDSNRRTFGILAGDRTFTLDSPPIEETDGDDTGDNTPVNTATNTQPAEGTFAFAPAVPGARSKSAADGEFASWGAWNAAPAEIAAAARSPLAGNVDFSAADTLADLPSGVVARYDGNAVALHTDAAGQASHVTGVFGLTYDFGKSRGAADLAIPDAGYDFRQIQVDQVGAGFAGTQNFGTDAASTVRLDGAFFNNAASTAGTLDINDVGAGSTTTGIFQGTRAPDK